MNGHGRLSNLSMVSAILDSNAQLFAGMSRISYHAIAKRYEEKQSYFLQV